MPFAPILIWIVIAVVRAASRSSSPAATTNTGVSADWDAGAVARILALVVWFVLAGLVTDALIHDEPTGGHLAVLVLQAFALAAFGAVLFAPWQLLRWLAQRADPKVVYYVARSMLVFSRTGESRATAILLAALAAAYRGPAPKPLRDWLWTRLGTEQSARGTFGTAYGLLEALEARAARDRKRLRKAHLHAERSRWLLGTVTYLSDQGVPKPVRRLAHELLDLEAVERGLWGALENTPEPLLTKLTRALRDFVRIRFGGSGAGKAAARSRRRARAPLVEALYVRPGEVPGPTDVAEARACASRDYLALLAFEPLTPRAGLQMLRTFDVLLHPEHPDTLVPAPLRDDELELAALHDEVADALAVAIHRSTGVPVFALPAFGPVSSRVFQKIEVEVLNDTERVLSRRIEATKNRAGAEPMHEWLEASRVRGAYRRVQFMLGDAAAARVWPRFMFAYCNFGVQLSESWPRRRPLAHAVFKCLHEEATRLEDAANTALLRRNVDVTASG